MSSASTKSPLPRTLIIMGVCGCGKSLIGSMLAKVFDGVWETPPP